MIDFRSDTVTRPGPAMLAAMIKAPVGDDVFTEDPTINQLEAETATLFGFEAGLFCSSGTMTNQIAIKCHTQPGDEVICDELSHIYQYEGGGIAFNSGCSVKLLQGNRGRITADDVLASINNPNDIHKAVSRLVSLENTVNRAGGSCYNLNDIAAIKNICAAHNLSLHLDGARVFNAIVANNETPARYGELFDTVSVCLSKGLGAPVGSVLLGPATFIQKSRRIRKILGGGMRQAGYLAAAGLYALENNIARLAEDHAHAKAIAAALQEKDFTAAILPVDTNIVIAKITGRLTPAQLVERLRQEEIYLFAIDQHHVRLVLHLDITPAMVQQTIDVIRSL